MSMDLRKCIGDKIYNLRMELELSQEEFVTRLNPSFSRGNLSNIEKGLTIPSSEFVKAVCEAYNISSDWLLDINNTINITLKEKQLLDTYNKLDLEIRQNILNLMESIVKQNK